ncbi:hypothetical protein HID58_048715 [Brassica napus]|uniref:KIB1-4 beta-propeller domain-containing protein n=2 Tax=Brassica TaxID=3705 RepID=A0ABQ8B2Y4_BRANA|nr:uncharacterized protein LOC106378408 [Brassica napus]KAH0899147.1 hypothetical protein HID58_048715 [Brassica napus]
MLLDYMLKLASSGKDSSDGRISIGKNSRSEQKHIVIKDLALVNEVRNAMTLRYNDFKVGISGDRTSDVRLLLPFQPTRSNPLNVLPPPLPTGSVIQNIAMTSYLDLEDEDWVLAVKLYGSKIKLFRRSYKPTWIDVNYMPPSIYTTSSLMYSKKDERFYVPTPGGDYLYSLDSKSTEDDRPEFIGLWTEDLTKYLNENQLEVNTFTTTVHFLEPPSGEQFFVKWFFYDEYEIYKGSKQVTSRTVDFIVFRAEDHPIEKKKKQLFYTDDIGDLCIFLGHGEPYCVRASSHPGLRANCIYFSGYNFGTYDINTKRCNMFFAEEDILSSTKFPYWPHP